MGVHLMTLTEAARAIGVTRRTVENWARRRLARVIHYGPSGYHVGMRPSEVRRLRALARKSPKKSEKSGKTV